MDVVKIEDLQYLQIGVQGETGTLNVQIDMTSWVEELEDRYTDLCFHLLFKPYGESTALPMATTYDAETHILTWEITLSATLVVGTGYTEIRALTHPTTGLLKKSRIIPTLVESSVSGIEGGTVPAPYEDWVNLVLATKDDLNQIFSGATTTYQNSDSGITVPTGAWTETPAPVKGKYLWSRIRFEWGTGSVSYLYTVGYVGQDGEGVVISVNGADGNVVLDAGDINVDKTAAIQKTIAATLSEKLNSSMIVYGSSAPANPVTGMLWLKPKG